MLEDALTRTFEEAMRKMLPGMVNEAVASALKSLEAGRPSEGFLTVQQAADQSSFAIETIRERIKAGDLVAVRPKGTREYRIQRRDLDAWLAGQASVPVASDDLESKARKIAARLGG